MIKIKFDKKAKALLFLLSVCILFPYFIIFASGAEEVGIICPSSSKASAVYLYNIEKGAVLFEKNPDKKISPASTVKLMTAITAYEKIKDINKAVTVTEKMLGDIQSNTMKLSVGESIRIKDLLAGLICSGYNDAANALSVIACGSVSSFVEAMNENASKLGAVNTIYVDPTGIDDSAQTTAYDVMLIAKEFMSHELLFEISASPSYEVPKTNMSTSRVLHNRNAMISNYTGSKYLNSNAIGMNSGMTGGGGYCAVTSMKQHDMTYICVVMGADYNDDTIYSYVIANELLNYIAKNLGYRSILSANEEISTIPIIGANLNQKAVSVSSSEDILVYLPSDYLDSGLLKISFVYFKDELTAPVSKGDKVGKIVIRYGDDIISVHDIITSEDVERDNFMYAMDSIRSFIFSRSAASSLICFVLTILLYIFIASRKSSVKRKRKNISMYRY